MDLDQLIAALASPPGAGAQGIVRISGVGVRTVIESGFRSDQELPAVTARRQSGTWRLSDSPVAIPCELYYWPTRRSYTGQPTAELHLPGSPPVLERVLADLYRRGVRPARPGEFTLRAFLAGKIDLVQAEAVLGVIDAHDDAELKTALEQLAGGISGRLAQLRYDLIDLLADLEAGLDFVEEDIEFVTRPELQARVGEARRFVESLIAQSESRMTSDVLPKVVLAGLPNAGKSTLFNRLAGQSLALVSAAAGTTRDYLRAHIRTGETTFELIDTAGWDETTDGIANAAQSRRADQLQRAALIVWCSACNMESSERSLDEEALSQVNLPVLHVWTKGDVNCLPSGMHERSSEEYIVSSHTGIGCDDLLRAIAKRLYGDESQRSLWLGTTAARSRESLERAALALARAEQTAAANSAGDELLAVDLREALDQLGTIVGAVYTDDLLDRIFSKFCIGK